MRLQSTVFADTVNTRNMISMSFSSFVSHFTTAENIKNIFLQENKHIIKVFALLMRVLDSFRWRMLNEKCPSRDIADSGRRRSTMMVTCVRLWCLCNEELEIEMFDKRVEKKNKKFYSVKPSAFNPRPPLNRPHTLMVQVPKLLSTLKPI